MDYTKIFAAIITFLAAVISGLLIPWLRGKISKIQWGQLVEWTRIAVAAAELLFLGSGRGNEKREYVIKWLKAKGIHFDDETIRAVLEAAVLEIKGESLGPQKN
ncbi:MAG: phage holin, LLH family [Christensenellales bacterium]|jgi:hypothetical protein